MKSWSLTFATQMLFRRSGCELFDIQEYFYPQNISTIKYEKCLENYNDKFQENLSRPGKIYARAWYRATVRRLRNTDLEESALRRGR